MSAPSARPAWARPEYRLVADAEDIVSGRRFRLWFDPTGVEKAKRWLFGRAEPLRYCLEEVETGALAGKFVSWEKAVAWHDRTVISAGWKMQYEPAARREEAALVELPGGLESVATTKHLGQHRRHP